MFSFDTSVILSGIGITITTAIVIFKSLNDKNEKLVTYGECIKNNTHNIDMMVKYVEKIGNDSNEIKINQNNLTAKLIAISESLVNITASNQIILTKINQHDIDIISFKKDIEFMKLEDIQKEKDIEYIKNRLEKLGVHR